MQQWIEVLHVDDCPPGTARETVAGDRVVAVYNVDGTIHAMDGVCPHQGGPLGKGSLSGCVVTCPWHGWQFDVRTGQSQLSSNVRQPTLPVRVVGGKVHVAIEKADE